MDVSCMIKTSIDENFNRFVLKLDYFSLEEICSNIYKSSYVNIKTIEMLYNIICKSNYVNSNMCLKAFLQD